MTWLRVAHGALLDIQSCNCLPLLHMLTASALNRSGSSNWAESVDISRLGWDGSSHIDVRTGFVTILSHPATVFGHPAASPSGSSPTFPWFLLLIPALQIPKAPLGSSPPTCSRTSGIYWIMLRPMHQLGHLTPPINWRVEEMCWMIQQGCKATT